MNNFDKVLLISLKYFGVIFFAASIIYGVLGQGKEALLLFMLFISTIVFGALILSK